MPSDLHGREGIHAGTSEGCGGRVAMIMEHDIGKPGIAAQPAENLPDRLDAPAIAREHIGDAVPLGIHCQR